MKGLRAYNPQQLYADGLLGQYMYGGSTGAVNASVVGDMLQFRWPDSIRLAAIRKVTVSVAISTPYGANPGVPIQLDIVKATGWTVQGSGGTNQDTTTGACKTRTNMPTSLLTSGDLRIATTTNLNAGTRTDSPLALATFDAPFTVGGSMVLLDRKEGDSDYPLVLGFQEGFVVRLTADPVTGIIVIGISVEWIEVDAR